MKGTARTVQCEQGERWSGLRRGGLVTDLESNGPDRDPDLDVYLPRHRKPQVVLSYAGQFHYSGRPRPEATGAVEAGTMAKPNEEKVSDLRDARRGEASAWERVRGYLLARK